MSMRSASVSPTDAASFDTPAEALGAAPFAGAFAGAFAAGFAGAFAGCSAGALAGVFEPDGFVAAIRS
jgi:hypothetical protein